MQELRIIIDLNAALRDFVASRVGSFSAQEELQVTYMVYGDWSRCLCTVIGPDVSDHENGLSSL